MNTELQTAPKTVVPLVEHRTGFAGDELEAAARLARAAAGDYVVYENAGVYRFATGVSAQIRLHRDGVRMHRPDGTDVHEPWDGQPLAQVRRMLASVQADRMSAYGWAAFELAYAEAGDPAGLAAIGDQCLLHLVIPRTEVVLQDGTVLIRTADEADIASVLSTLSRAGRAGTGRTEPVDIRALGGEEYRRAVSDALGEIEDGELQKVILSRSVQLPLDIDLVDTYVSGRRGNTPARSFLVRLGGLESAGFCPEIVVQVSDSGRAVIQPLAGTRARTGDPEKDALLQAELLADSKEIYEHAISVLVASDDLARVCPRDSINVEEFMTVCERGTVHHLGSRVAGTLAPGYDAWDAFAAAFPAVTASGVPKSAAYASIRAHEEQPRGLYSGAVFTVDADGGLDAGLVLRAVYRQDGVTWLRAGAGILRGSRPAREFEETCEKLDSVARFLVPARGGADGRR